MKQRQNLLGIVIYEQALAVCQVERKGNEYCSSAIRRISLAGGHNP